MQGQGAVTYAPLVEMFTNEIKMESGDQGMIRNDDVLGGMATVLFSNIK